MKICCKCKAQKPFEQFSRNKSTKDGLAFECKECVRAYHRAARRERGDEVRAADNARFHTEKRQASIARYRSSEKGKEAIARARNAWRSQHPDRQHAANMVSTWVRRGKLKKQPCFVCGKSRVEGHHPDYSRPLDVVWLCVKHHKEVHLMVTV